MPRPRKTRDIWEVHGDYGYGHGFEPVTAEESWTEAKARLHEHRDNEPGIRFKLVKTRERIREDRVTSKRPAGRPAKTPEATCNEPLLVRFTQAEHKTILAAAKRRKLPLARFVRECAARAELDNEASACEDKRAGEWWIHALGGLSKISTGPFASANEAKKYAKDRGMERGSFKKSGAGSWVSDNYEVSDRPLREGRDILAPRGKAPWE